MSGKTTCKEVTSTCKCKIIEKPIKEKKECVATIVGVLSLPQNFCRQDDCEESSCQKSECGESNCEQDDCCEKKDDCAEVYRDFGECLQKCFIKANKNNSCC